MAKSLQAALVLWVTAFQALAQSLPAPNYDAFSDRDGNIITKEQGRALFSVLRSPGQLEAIYADAEKGSARARRVFLELETNYFPSIGREVAELTSRPACLVPVVRELSGWCIPDWSFVDFLQKDKPGGARLRKALFDGFAERATTAIREAESATISRVARAPSMPRTLVPAPRGAALPEAGVVGRVSGVKNLRSDRTKWPPEND